VLHFEGKPQRRVGGRGIAAPASGDIAATAARCTDEASTLLQASLYIGHNQDTGGEGSLSGATQFRLEQQPAPGPTEALSSNGGLLAVATAAADCSIAVLAVFYGGPRYPPETDELHAKSTHRINAYRMIRRARPKPASGQASLPHVLRDRHHGRRHARKRPGLGHA
jgi:hypothetical protein